MIIHDTKYRLEHLKNTPRHDIEDKEEDTEIYSDDYHHERERGECVYCCCFYYEHMLVIVHFLRWTEDISPCHKREEEDNDTPHKKPFL